MFQIVLQNKYFKNIFLLAMYSQNFIYSLTQAVNLKN